MILCVARLEAKLWNVEKIPEEGRRCCCWCWLVSGSSFTPLCLPLSVLLSVSGPSAVFEEAGIGKGSCSLSDGFASCERI